MSTLAVCLALGSTSSRLVALPPRLALGLAGRTLCISMRSTLLLPARSTSSLLSLPRLPRGCLGRLLLRLPRM
mgnify:CR=1 FL=1